MEFQSKLGTFEWIIDYADLRQFIQLEYSRLCATDTNYKPSVCVIGCGTSTLSISLAQEFAFQTVVSNDNDGECIRHMNALYPASEAFHWLCYDIVEDIGVAQHNILDINNSFDIIIDKGTFDAILVEGSTTNMFHEINRLLSHNGSYILCSIHNSDFLRQFLSNPELNFSVEVFEIDLSVYRKACVAICRRNNATYIATACDSANDDNNFDLSHFNDYEKAVMDQFYKIEQPLLTTEYKQQLKQNFDNILMQHRCSFSNTQTNTNFDGSIDLSTYVAIEYAYDAMFSPQQQLELQYSYDMFLDDLKQFELGVAGHINYDEAVLFLEQMQWAHHK